MIVVTGGAGFIGSALVWKLNEQGIKDILVVDHFGAQGKWKNLGKRQVQDLMHKDEFLGWISEAGRHKNIDAIFHMGACSSTTENDMDYLVKNNLHYSQHLFDFCTRYRIPFIYASSGSTYGMGEFGYSDNQETTTLLRPIHPYGFSKQLFDLWVLSRSETPPYWAGLKFFNVYGPQEYHKGSQASVIYHAFPQVRDKKVLRLFKSYKQGFGHGEQKRDFVYVKDVVKVMAHLFKNADKSTSGIYNLGTGQARSFADLGRAVFSAMGHLEAAFEWIEMPENLRSQYQYFTEATLTNLKTKAGFEQPFTSLEEGVKDYVQNYLLAEDPFL